MVDGDVECHCIGSRHEAVLMATTTTKPFVVPGDMSQPEEVRRAFVELNRELIARIATLENKIKALESQESNG